MLVSPWPNTTLFSAMQPENASLPMVVTVSGITTALSPLLFLNALALISLMV